ncbi:MAG TPA: hypothetical protein VGQ34_00085 [Sphingomicrobium sp.]|nr:hypothetical protein [Sphingomicrobium sp.]
MDVVGDYDVDGFLIVRGLIPKEVARAFMSGIKKDLGPASIRLSHSTEHPDILKRPTYQVHGKSYRPMTFFLWGLTPIVGKLIGREILPTFDYFRLYREGDICRVHSDRPACQHAVSLTLDYSDGEPWPLEVGRCSVQSYHPLQEGWDKDHSSIEMEVGDAVLYQGFNYPHGRTTPNPNAWSAHLFLCYVDRSGPYRDEAFDRDLKIDPVNFAFA